MNIYRQRLFFVVVSVLVVLGGIIFSLPSQTAKAQSSQSGSLGLEGVVQGKPPTQAAVISFPTNGQAITALPITVTGICPDGVLVRLYKNNVFSGAAQCTNGNFSILTDLFSGRNDLVAKVFDDLEQQGPDSSTVTVNFNDPANTSGIRVSVTSVYAKRGANPGTVLTWPLTISGGTAPFAVSVDWGDKSVPDLISRQFPGDFTVSHTYDAAGVYNIIVKVTDKAGVSSFLQLVGIGNGKVQGVEQTNLNADGSTASTVRIIVWWPLALIVPFIIITFWLGKRHQLHVIRKKINQGQRPF
jgi:hypothetical protein